VAVDGDATTFTVLALKGLIGPKLSPPATEDQQKLVFRGRILKDTDTLEACGPCRLLV